MGCLKLPYHSNQEYRETSFSHLKVAHNMGVKSHRYGFQGQEKDDEIKGKGNSLNYTYRMHDARLGRFFAIDPLSSKYHHFSPYMFSANKVIRYVELEGLENGMPDVGGAMYSLWEGVANMFTWTSNEYEKSAIKPAVDFMTSMEAVHVGLDILGCIPVLGTLPDGINGFIYTLEGDHVNAAFSYAAIIPIAGIFGTASKYVIRVGKNADEAVEAAKVFDNLADAKKYVEGVAGSADEVASAVVKDVDEVAGAVSDINKQGGKQNCVSCAIATDNTLAGAPTSALPASPVTSSSGALKYADEAQPISILEKQYGSTFKSVDINKVGDVLSEGERAIVYGYRSDGTAHVFNAVNQKGKINFLDGQTGGGASLDGFLGFKILKTTK